MAELGEKLSEKELCPDDLLRGQEEAFQRDIERLQKQKPGFVNVTCPACDRRDHQPAFTKFDFDYVTCNACQTLYMNPRPSPAIMQSYYSNSENYRYWAKYIFPASESARREKIHRPWLERVLSYCERYSIDSSSLVEVGAGFGTFSWLAQQSGKFKRLVVVEPTPEMAAACRARGLTVIEKPIEDLDRDFDPPNIVVSFEVIEHLFRPRDFLGQCRRILAPGGLLVISCPNGLGFDVSMLGAASLAVDPEHVNLFNPASLSDLVRECGFNVLEVSTPGRLDAEFVREAILTGKLPFSDPFLKRVLIEEWERLGWPFQQFLAANGLSSHMWLAARKS